jgi:hypothetical protein
MVNRYIKRLENGEWGDPFIDANFDAMALEDVLASGYYPFEPVNGPNPDIDYNATYEYVLFDNVVRMVWTLTRKTGEELQRAMRDKWAQVRAERNQLLSGCDFTQLVDAPVTPEKRAEWVVYRQALRDITLQSDPFAIVWPTDPNHRTNSLEVARV